MRREYKKLLENLNRRDIINWVPELSLGELAYDFLFEKLDKEGNTLSANQIRNAMHSLYMLRHWKIDEYELLLSLIMKYTSDPRIKVRTEAVKLSIGLIHRFKSEYAIVKNPSEALKRVALLHPTESEKRAIQVALDLGLEKPVIQSVRKFLEIDMPKAEESRSD